MQKNPKIFEENKKNAGKNPANKMKKMQKNRRNSIFIIQNKIAAENQK